LPKYFYPPSIVCRHHKTLPENCTIVREIMLSQEFIMGEKKRKNKETMLMKRTKKFEHNEENKVQFE